LSFKHLSPSKLTKAKSFNPCTQRGFCSTIVCCGFIYGKIGWVLSKGILNAVLGLFYPEGKGCWFLALQ